MVGPDDIHYVSVNHTLETILTWLMHVWAVMWQAGRHRLSYP